MILPELLVELLRCGMAVVLFEGGENYYGSDNLQFYTTNYGDPSTAYSAQTNAGYYSHPYSNYHHGVSSGGFWSAFGTGGFDDEPPLLEGMFLFERFSRVYSFDLICFFFKHVHLELGINFGHIKTKAIDLLIS